MDLKLKDKIIIVSGGAKGIGEGISYALSSEGAFVVVVGRNMNDNKKVVSKINKQGGNAFDIAAELTNPKACEHVINKIAEKFKRIDGIVNNAGKNDGVSLEFGTYRDFIDSLHRNLVHYYLLTHYSLPYLKKNRGVILNISSKTAETGQGGTSGYAASNGGRNALTREWAVELLNFGIRVNAIIVSECLTPSYKRWVQKFKDPKDKLKEISEIVPFEKRMTTVEEIANMAVFLLSERSSHTTGQLIHIDGGYVHLDRGIGRFSINS